jgi:hypothetical protein
VLEWLEELWLVFRHDADRSRSLLSAGFVGDTTLSVLILKAISEAIPHHFLSSFVSAACAEDFERLLVGS